MDEPQRKLGELAMYMPHAPTQVVLFGGILAQYLRLPLLSPDGFVFGCDMAILALMRSAPRDASGNATEGIGFLESQIPAIADVIFEKEDAERVRASFERSRNSLAVA